MGPALFLTFTFFVFGPMEMYVTNASNFFFDLKTLIVPVLVLFLVIFFVILAVNILLEKYLSVAALTFSIGLGLYVQGNWMQLDYGEMDGRAIDWSGFGSWGLINGVVWLVILAVPVVLSYVLKNKKLYRPIINYVSYGLVAMQCITLVVILFTTDLEKNAVYLEKDAEMYQLSSEKNVVVMLFDAFQASYFEQAIEELPEAKETFEGFTFFDNAVGTSLFSEEGGATVFAGEQMQADKNLVENVQYIYEESELFPALVQEDYDIRYYINSKMVSPDMIGTIQNLKSDTTGVNSFDLMKLMLKITAFRYMPHDLKQNFWFSYEEINALNQSEEASKFAAGNDFLFYEDITSGAVTADLEKKAYRVYYFKGVHPPYNMTENVEYIDYGDIKNDITYFEDIRDNEMLYEQTLGSVQIMMEFVRELKEQGVYDQTTILITADHGWENRYNPMLLIKPENSTGDFVISHAPVSYIEDFVPTVLNAVGEQYTDQKTVFDYQEGEVRYRKFYIYDNINAADRSYQGISVYGTYGEADDISSYMLEKDEGELKYELGTEITFTEDGNGRRYFLNGISGVENDFCWSSGESSILRFDIGDVTDDLVARFAFKNVYAGEQHVVVKSGNQLLLDKTVLAKEPAVEFNIPKECVQDGMVTLEFYYLDAGSPAEDDPTKTDTRVLALAFSQIYIEEANGRYIEDAIQEPQLEKTAVLDFSQDGNCQTYLGSGWYGQESQGRWTSEQAEVTLLFQAGEYDSIEINATPYPASGVTRVLLNGQEIGSIQDSGISTFAIPEEALDAREIQTLTFVTEGATSPKAQGESDDDRALGIYVMKVQLLLSA